MVSPKPNLTYSTLLALPREIRDLVYAYLLRETYPAPEDPDHAGSRVLDSNIYFQAHSPRPALLQLKLCNKQIHAEVQDAWVRRTEEVSASAHLDVMVKGTRIWPTWLYLPRTSHLSPTVHVELRYFDNRGQRGSEFSTGAYRALWSLFNLLISHGPCLIHNRIGGLPTPLRVRRLRFEIRLCFPASVDDLFGTYRDVFERLERLAIDNVGLGRVEMIEACLGMDRRVWRLKQLPTGLTLASRVA